MLYLVSKYFLGNDDMNQEKIGEFIKKIRYCDAEYRDNTGNVEDPSLNQGQGDGMNVRVWWDTNRYK